MNILESARNTLMAESLALTNLARNLDCRFEKSVEIILNCKGRLVITGIGKSAIIGQKIAATLNSTGTPALFMHAADAIHGDLGMVQKDDVVLCISNSGNSPEIRVLIPLLKNMGNVLIGMVGNQESILAKESQFLLDASVEREACPHNLAPTTSTTAQLAVGDALAICLMQVKNFKPADFARYHPGGNIGKRLFTKVGDLLNPRNVPMVGPEAAVKEIIMEISAKMLGATAVTDGGALLGIITDGDLRRMLEKHTEIGSIKAGEVMTPVPKSIDVEALATEALEMMEKHRITQLPVLKDKMYVGIVHLHQIIREGIF